MELRIIREEVTLHLKLHTIIHLTYNKFCRKEALNSLCFDFLHQLYVLYPWCIHDVLEVLHFPPSHYIPSIPWSGHVATFSSYFLSSLPSQGFGFPRSLLNCCISGMTSGLSWSIWDTANHVNLGWCCIAYAREGKRQDPIIAAYWNTDM